MAQITALTGEKIYIDASDLEKVSQYEWKSFDPFKKGTKYFRTQVTVNGKNKTYLLNRLIMNEPKGKVVHYINGDTFDNRKCNLRICTRAENVRSSRIRKENTSGYKGVSYFKKKWVALIRVNKKKLYLGRYDNKNVAASAYNEAAINYFGEYARLNTI